MWPFKTTSGRIEPTRYPPTPEPVPSVEPNYYPPMPLTPEEALHNAMESNYMQFKDNNDKHNHFISVQQNDFIHKIVKHLSEVIFKDFRSEIEVNYSELKLSDNDFKSIAAAFPDVWNKKFKNNGCRYREIVGDLLFNRNAIIKAFEQFAPLKENETITTHAYR